MNTVALNTALASTKKSPPTPDLKAQKKAQRAIYRLGQDADLEFALANPGVSHRARDALPGELLHLPHGGTVLVTVSRFRTSITRYFSNTKFVNFNALIAELDGPEAEKVFKAWRDIYGFHNCDVIQTAELIP